MENYDNIPGHIRQQYGAKRASYVLTVSETDDGKYALQVKDRQSDRELAKFKDRQLSGLVAKMSDEMSLPVNVHVTNNEGSKKFYLMYKEALRTEKTMTSLKSANPRMYKK